MSSSSLTMASLVESPGTEPSESPWSPMVLPSLRHRWPGSQLTRRWGGRPALTEQGSLGYMYCNMLLLGFKSDCLKQWC